MLLGLECVHRMTEGITIPKELFDKMLRQILATDMHSFGSNHNAREIYRELNRLGIWLTA